MQSSHLGCSNADAITQIPRARGAIDLINQWGVGRKGFDDGLAIMWNTTRQQCLSRILSAMLHSGRSGATAAEMLECHGAAVASRMRN